MLQRLHVGDRKAGLARENLGDTPVPRVLRTILEEEWRVVARWMDVMIRRRDPSARRVELAREIAAQAIPLVLAGAGHGQPPMPVGPLGRRGRRLPRNVSALIAADHVLGGRVVVRLRLEKLFAIVQVVVAECGDVAGIARQVHRRAHRVRLVMDCVLVEHRPVSRELLLRHTRRRALHLDRVARDAERFPRAAEPDLIAICRIHLFDVHVRLVGADNRQTPRNSPVVADRDAGQHGFGGANHIPSRRIQVHDVANRRVGDITVRIIGHDHVA